jgi:putative oxidoreductase
MRDFGLFLLRLALGGLLTGHGAQKLFGAFGGHGLEGTGGFFESALGLRPGKKWAFAAGAGEFGGGLLTVLGFMHPIGPISTLGPMIVAWGKAHRGKPIWASEGGAELPLLNMSIAVALICTGPGKWSIDKLFGIRVNPLLAMLSAAAVAAGSYLAINQPEKLARLMGATQQQTPEPAISAS